MPRSPASRPFRRLAVVAALAATFAGCGPSRVPRVDPATLAPDIRIVQAIAVRFGDREMLGRGVVVKSGSHLDVFVLAPTGTRLLTVRQDGLDVTSEVRVPELSRLDPDRLLRDIRWAFFARCPAPAGSPTAPRRCRIDGASVVETIDPATGTVATRTFTRGRDRVRFDQEAFPDAPSSDAIPRRLVLREDRYGYTLDIVVESVERPEGTPPSR